MIYRATGGGVQKCTPIPPTKMYPLYYIIIYKFKNKNNYIITYIMGYKNVPPPYRGAKVYKMA